jgi:uncharacterized ubiquitin-like protein YukD
MLTEVDQARLKSLEERVHSLHHLYKLNSQSTVTVDYESHTKIRHVLHIPLRFTVQELHQSIPEQDRDPYLIIHGYPIDPRTAAPVLVDQIFQAVRNTPFQSSILPSPTRSASDNHLDVSDVNSPASPSATDTIFVKGHSGHFKVFGPAVKSNEQHYELRELIHISPYLKYAELTDRLLDSYIQSVKLESLSLEEMQRIADRVIAANVMIQMYHPQDHSFSAIRESDLRKLFQSDSACLYIRMKRKSVAEHFTFDPLEIFVKDKEANQTYVMKEFPTVRIKALKKEIEYKVQKDCSTFVLYLHGSFLSDEEKTLQEYNVQTGDVLVVLPKENKSTSHDSILLKKYTGQEFRVQCSLDAPVDSLKAKIMQVDHSISSRKQIALMLDGKELQDDLTLISCGVTYDRPIFLDIVNSPLTSQLVTKEEDEMKEVSAFDLIEWTNYEKRYGRASYGNSSLLTRTDYDTLTEEEMLERIAGLRCELHHFQSREVKESEAVVGKRGSANESVQKFVQEVRRMSSVTSAHAHAVAMAAVQDQKDDAIVEKEPASCCIIG